MEAQKFSLVEDELPTRFVMHNSTDQRVDFHPITLDEEGGGIQILQEGTSFRYPPEGFKAFGAIADRVVRCLSPEVQILCHVGYEPDENDYHDVRLLHERFNIPLPFYFISAPQL